MPQDINPEELANLLGEAVDNTSPFDMVRTGLAILTQAYFNMSNLFEEQGDIQAAKIFAAVCEDVHQLYHLTDDLITAQGAEGDYDGTD